MPRKSDARKRTVDTEITSEMRLQYGAESAHSTSELHHSRGRRGQLSNPLFNRSKRALIPILTNERVDQGTSGSLLRFPPFLILKARALSRSEIMIHQIQGIHSLGFEIFFDVLRFI